MKRAGEDREIILIVARNVREARKAAGLSQEELAHEADVDRTYISQVERQKRNLTVSVLARIARALSTTPDKLLIPLSGSTSKSPSRRRN